MLSALADTTGLRLLTLAPATGPSGPARLPDYATRSRSAQAFLGAIRRGALLLCYPDLALFHPPAWSKLPVFLALAATMRRLRARPDVRVWVDWVDLPRWQSIDLDYPLRLPRPILRWVERILCASADRVTVPSPAMADLLAANLALPRSRFTVLPNGVQRRFLGKGEGFRTPADGETVRFLYSGTLDRRRGRGLEPLVETFRRVAPDCAELVLVGTGGAWLEEGPADRRIRRVEASTDEDWLVEGRRCHVGLIPYPERFYFKICLPSKIAFYGACNLRLLSSDLPETARWLERYGLGRAMPLANFAEVFAAPRRFLDEVDEASLDPAWRQDLEWEGNLEDLVRCILES